MVGFGMRQAMRSMWARPNVGFTSASIVVLAFGIAASTTLFAVLYATLLAPLPFRDAERVFDLAESKSTAGLESFSVSAPNYLSWSERARGYEGLAAMMDSNVNLGAGATTERVESLSVTPNFWQVLGLPLLSGRTFTADEDRLDAPVVIVGEALWRSRHGADPALVGRALQVDGIPRTVIGISPADVGFSQDTGIWLPAALREQPWGRGDRRVRVLGRLAPEVTREAADAEMRSIAADLEREFPDENRGWSVVSQPVRDVLVGAPLATRVLTSSAAVLLLLLVACLNVANLQVARATTRVRELGVRQALGATRGRLMRLVVGESLLLAGLGGALGFALATISIRAVATGPWLPAARLPALQAELPVLLATIVLSALAALASGLAPALVTARVGVAGVLGAAGRSSTDRGRAPLRQVLVIAQFALATLLAVASVLLVQQFRAVQSQSLGFRTEQVLSARITLPDDDNGTRWEENTIAYQRLLGEIATVPGVERVGLGSEVPLGRFNTTSMQIAVGSDAAAARERGLLTAWRLVTGEFLDVLGVPVLRGRGFAASGESRRSMLLSEGLARRLFPDADPVGQTVTLSNGQQWQVVGVVGDVRQLDRAGEVTPTVYLSTNWIMLPTMTLALRTSGDPRGVIEAVRERAARALPGHPLFDLTTLDALAAENLAQPRAQTLAVSLFGLVSLLLAAVGVLGTTSYLVSRRTPELAVRLALGATPSRVVRQVLAGGGALCLSGIAIGLLLSLALARAAASVLHAPDANVAGALLLVGGTLAVVGLVACTLPAMRAARIQPSQALRGE